MIQVIRYSVNIAKEDTEERGGGGDGLAKDIHHKGEGQEVIIISVGFSFILQLVKSLPFHIPEG